MKGVQAALLGVIEFPLHDLNIPKLLFQLCSALVNLSLQGEKLTAVIALGLVHADQLFGFGQGKSQSFIAQYQFQGDPIGGGVDPSLAPSLRSHQALIFVKADGTGGHVEFPGQLADAVGLFFTHGKRIGEVYVNVKLLILACSVRDTVFTSA